MRMTLLGIIACLLLASCSGETIVVEEEIRLPGVTILPGSAILMTQDDVELLSGVREIRGGILIGDRDTESEIYSLRALNSLETVGHGIWLRNLPHLETVEGLDALRTLGRNLRFEDLPQLKNLAGLGALREVGGDLLIDDLPQLRNLAGPGALREIGGALEIKECPSLESLTGLRNLSRCDKLSLSRLPLLESLHSLSQFHPREIRIEETGLSNLNGLAQLDSLSRIRLWKNPALTNLSGLSTLTYAREISLSFNESLTSLSDLDSCIVGEALFVWSCDALRNLVGLEGTTELRVLSLGNNESLMDLQGLENVEAVRATLYIRVNPVLCDTTIENWLGGIEHGGTHDDREIYGNAVCVP